MPVTTPWRKEPQNLFCIQSETERSKEPNRNEPHFQSLLLLTHSNSEGFCLAHAQCCAPCGVLLKGWGQRIHEQQTQMLMREEWLEGGRMVSENATARKEFPVINSEGRHNCLIDYVLCFWLEVITAANAAYPDVTMPAGLNAQGSGIPISDAMGKYKVNGIHCDYTPL